MRIVGSGSLDAVAHFPYGLYGRVPGEVYTLAFADMRVVGSGSLGVVARSARMRRICAFGMWLGPGFSLGPAVAYTWCRVVWCVSTGVFSLGRLVVHACTPRG